jgi:hypothetical protein
MGVLKECIDSLSTAGLPIYSSELDLAGSDEEQLDWYQKIFPILWEHPNIHGVTLWGWTDSWLLRISNPKDARLIINGRERPAMEWLREYVEDHKDVTSIIWNKQLHIAPAGQSALKVFDLMGRTVFSGRNRGNSPTAPFSFIHGNGTYIYKLQDENTIKKVSIIRSK